MSEFAERIDTAARALLMDPGVKLEHGAVFERVRKAGATPAGAPFTLRIPSGLIDQALARTEGTRGAAARLLGLKRTTLVEKLRRLAGDRDDGTSVPSIQPRRTA